MSRGRSSVRIRGMRRRFAGSVLLLVCAVALAGARFVLPAGAGTEAITFGLKERNGSGVTGNVVLESADGVTWFTVEVSGPDANYLPLVRAGTCGAFEDSSATPLALATLGEQVATAIDIPIDRLTTGGFVVDLHIAGGDIEELLDPAHSVACGAIPALSDSVQSTGVDGPDDSGDPVTADAAGDTEAGQGTETDGPDEADEASPAEGIVQLRPPDAGIGPIQSDRDWMMVTAAVLGVASFALAVNGLLAERQSTRTVAAGVVGHGRSPGQIVAQRAHRVRRLTRGLSE